VAGMDSKYFPLVQSSVTAIAVLVALLAYFDNQRRERVKHTLSLFDAFNKEISLAVQRRMHLTGMKEARDVNSAELSRVLGTVGKVMARVEKASRLNTDLRRLTDELREAMKSRNELLKSIIEASDQKQAPLNAVETLQEGRMKAEALSTATSSALTEAAAATAEAAEAAAAAKEPRPESFRQLSQDVRDINNFFSAAALLYSRQIIDRRLYLDQFCLTTLQSYVPIMDVLNAWTEIGRTDTSNFRLLALHCQWHYRSLPGPKDEYLYKVTF
jgi:hypothetical protein